MADFEGIPLFGERAVGGAILILRMPPTESGIARLPGNAEVEIQKDTPAIVVRGIDASDYESVIAAAPELANKGLDILAMTGRATLGLEDVWLTHAVWWTTRESIVVRFWCSATMLLTITGSANVYGPDGALKTPDVEPTPAWQESMRYFRMSELTDDLFDAFRNIYLALESLLSMLAPVRLTGDGRAAEREMADRKSVV